jgi:hypothetical protein
MPRDKQKNCYDSSSSELSTSFSSSESYCKEQCRPCGLCKPFKGCKSDCSSSSAECSSLDFSSLCDDEEKRCFSSSSSSDDSESEHCYTESDSCRGCSKKCNDCNKCKSCQCKECSDNSLSSVLNSLCNSSDSSSCSDSSSSSWDDDSLLCKDRSRKCKKQKRKHHSKKGKKFVVSWGDKTGHQWSDYNDDTESIHVNGKNGPVLHLHRGCTYFFCVDQDVPEGAEAEHLFILTTSPVGGSSSKPIRGGFNPIAKGCICFKVEKYTPRYFYYQCARHLFEGGLVIVHD